MKLWFPPEPPLDFCCLPSPRIVLRRTAGMAFNFSAATLAPARILAHRSPVRAKRTRASIFVPANFLPSRS
jgi:hypothetical protein